MNGARNEGHVRVRVRRQKLPDQKTIIFYARLNNFCSRRKVLNCMLNMLVANKAFC